VENGIFEGYVNSGLTTIASVEELIDVINLPRAPDSEFQDGISPRLAFKKLFTSLKRHNPTKIVVKWTAEEAYKRCLASFAQDSYHLVTPTKKLSAEQLQVAKAKFLAMPVKLAPSRWNRS
jgi:hypothetical protein